MQQLSTQQWTTRYEAASTLFNTTVQMVEIARQIEQVAGATDATVHFFTGNDAAISAPVSAKRIGIFAGTFNPLTDAHVAVAEAARREAGIECIVWLCAVASVDKELLERATLADRLAQLIAYANAVPGNIVALVNRGLYVEQAAAIKAHLVAETELTEVIGYDKIVQIFDQHYYVDREAALAELFALAQILVAPRGPATQHELTELLSLPENRQYANKVYYLPLPAVYHDDSSTTARQLAAELSPSTTASDALREMVVPEGVALAATTRAYAPTTDGYYAWRNAWIQALLTMPAEVILQLPTLDVQCLATMAADQRGQQLRAWLAQSAERRTQQYLLALL